MTRYFVISDTHFNHDNIITYCQRPFANSDEMNVAMIKAWNAVVGPSDHVFVLGDFAYKSRKNGHIDPEGLLAMLHGTKDLIIGNHDLEFDIDRLSGWNRVDHYREFKHEKRRFVMSHYPMETWRNAQHGWIMFHGHTHGSLKRVIPHRFDVGVDVTRLWAPVDIMEYAEVAAKQKFEPQDHHGE